MNWKRTVGALIIGTLIILLIRYSQSSKSSNLVMLQGTTMGPIPYTVKYLHSENKSHQVEVDSLLIGFNNSLSTYIPQSEISKFNIDDTLVYESSLFYPVLQKSKEIFELTEGAFDPTVGPLVNAWGFGPGKENRYLDSLSVDSLLQMVGFDKIVFDEKTAIKKVPDMYLDFSAIAKGYGVDVVGLFLESKGVTNYMVEIGGEVRCRGVNENDKPWLIGIEDPTVTDGDQKLFTTVFLKDRSLATSGNYRNFYVVDGKKISHTISPFTGYPVNHSLLSASVFASDCMTADALATGFMVLGVERAIEIVEKTEGFDAILIYSNKEGELQTYVSEGIKNFTDVK
jgi:thiamine biosynthesis lipoprotein